ncbi:MAG: BolA family protein [Rhodanobacteraceae bacterium]
MNRMERIRHCLEVSLEPKELDVIDEGHKHVGHAGAKDGRGHFCVRIVSNAFAGKAPLQRHRMVFQALGSMMQTDIHALSVEAKTEEES